ncbi:UNVERIFIED_CONTAM: Cysteine-rich receptor-like protein kinase [Sesamum calycinum]|uniref:non-specific serine/threonine protein kinase n=1 Tax=Sesamum calycinum TaxID=2727403 RepID=A0AAW2P974_9LAMI
MLSLALLDEADDDIISIDSIHYDFEKIRAATNDFSDDNKLGQGGFGAVYWGTLENGQEIGVKRLSMNSGQGDAEFKNEVLLLVKLQHKNLVRLLGFASQGRERLLVYEFVRNGSLDNFIFDPIKASSLDWDKRYTIIRGIARGLLYLHEDSMLRIIHRDLKASNVLLDENMNPKISDFGMARLLELDQSNSRHNKQDCRNLAWRNWRQGTTADVVDPVLKATSSFQIDILRCIHIALLCVQENAADRPTMSSVVLMLNSSSLTLPIPSQPAFHLPNSTEWESSTSSRSNTMQPRSNNDVSISEFGPR